MSMLPMLLRLVKLITNIIWITSAHYTVYINVDELSFYCSPTLYVVKSIKSIIFSTHNSMSNEFICFTLYNNYIIIALSTYFVTNIHSNGTS